MYTWCTLLAVHGEAGEEETSSRCAVWFCSDDSHVTDPPRVSGEHETATGVMDPRHAKKGVHGLRWINMVITLIRGWIWRDLTLFPSGSSNRMGVSSNANKL